MDTKFCSFCQITKPVSDFYRNKGRYDGLSAYCRQCQIVKNAAAEAAVRARVLTHLGGVCTGLKGVCSSGFDDPKRVDTLALHIDHVAGGGNAERRDPKTGGRQAFYKRVLASEPGTEFQLLCSNCNHIKRTLEGEFVGSRVYEREVPTERVSKSHPLRDLQGWARDYDACIECGTTERRHITRGLCENCYQRERKRTGAFDAADGAARREATAARDSLIRKLKDEQGLSNGRISLQLGVSKPTVARSLTRTGGNDEPEHETEKREEIRKELSAISRANWQNEEVAEKRRTGIREHNEAHADEVAERNRANAAAHKLHHAEANVDRNTTIVELRRTGKRMQEIADALGLSVSTVSTVCEEAGVERFHVPRQQTQESLRQGGETRRAKNAERNARIMELLAQGLTQSAIAEELGMKRTAVGQVIRRERARIEDKL